MLSQLRTATIIGVEAQEIEVEVEVSGGLPGFHLVGLPNGAVREGAVRIRAALSNSGFEVGSVRVTVNLAPADLRKDGAAFDLPIAIGILSSRKLITLGQRDLLLAGELSLDGRVKPIRGALSLAEEARRRGRSGILLPQANAAEAALVPGIEVYGVGSLGEAAAFLAGGRTLAPAPVADASSTSAIDLDFTEIVGQVEARQAAEVAAAGGHNLLLVGPPGSGKTMIAQRISTILPPLALVEAIETTKVHSVAGLLDGVSLVRQRPFRAPHHTSSCIGLVGGGGRPRPGEVSLAHNGVLFLDELPEFQRPALEALRQPLEERRVTVVRSQYVVTFPAAFMLVAAMNPCPCGYRGSRIRTCICGERETLRYVGRVSGPLLDRFDLMVAVDPPPAREVVGEVAAESSAAIRARVLDARLRQQRRLAGERLHCNAQMSSRDLRRLVPLSLSERAMLSSYAELHGLSARALHRVCRVARTVADLAGKEHVEEEHLLLALSLQRVRWVN